MNILILSELLYPHGGGAELATYLYANLLAEDGFNVSVVTNKFNKEQELSKRGTLTIYRLPIFHDANSIKYSVTKRFDILFSSFMKKLLKWADIVYIPRFWYSAIPLTKALEKPIIVHLHDYIPICSLAVLYNKAEEKICNGKRVFCSPKCVYLHEKFRKRSLIETLFSVFLNINIGRYLPRLIELSDAVICVSEYQRKVIAAGRSSIQGKLHTIYNPILDLPTIEINGDDFGYFGGPDVFKGFYVLYKALLHLSQKSLVKIRIHSTKFPEWMRNNISSLNKIGVILYNKLGVDELLSIYKNIRAVVFPSIWPEPWPYVVVEALIQGRLVLASKVGGVPEQVEGCKGVQLFNVGDYVKLAECMEYISSLGREEIIDIGLHNRDVFLKRFNTESSIKRFVDVIDSIM